MTLHQLPTIDRTSLARWADEDRLFALIEVLPDHAAPSAGWVVSATFPAPIDFLDQIAALHIRKTRPVVLYESARGTLGVQEAAEALMNAGFHEVYRFVGPQAAFYASQHLQA